MTKERALCCIRREPVAETPEERVRQALLKKMTEELGFPAHLLAVEKALHQFPHLAQKRALPDCRVDIACFASNIFPGRELSPLLIIECKAVPITGSALEQVIGYNYFCEAPYVAVANEQSIRLSWLGDNGWESIDFLPHYQDLLYQLGEIEESGKIEEERSICQKKTH